MRLFPSLAGAAAAAWCGCAAAAPLPPSAPQHPSSVTYYGETVIDPYGWMEAMSPEFHNWAHAQNAYMRTTLDSLPGYAELARQVTAAGNAFATLSMVQRVGDVAYYEKQGPGEAQPSLYRRALDGGAERRLVDPVAFGDSTTSIHEYSVAPDNQHLAVALASGGSEEATLQILDIRSGRTLQERIDRARAASPVWSPDGTVVFYTRLKPHFTSPSDRFSDLSVFAHRPGEDPARDRPVFTAASVGSEIGRSAYIGLLIPPGSTWALGFANSGVSREAEWFAAPLATLMAGAPRWRRVARLADRLVLSLDSMTTTQPFVRGDWAWFATTKDAGNAKLVRLDLAHPGPPTEVVAERQARLAGLAGAADGLYLAYASGSSYWLERSGLDGGGTRRIAQPFEGTIKELSTDPRREGAVLGIESWARPATYFVAARDAMRGLDLAPEPTIDLSMIVTETVTAKAADGTAVPISVTHRRDLRRDGSAPALVEAYGAYGFAYDPTFHPELVPFLQRGGVWAVVHVRGGGEFGERWHLAGQGANKPNTWRDFIAALRTLDADRITSAAKTTGFGASAGGIMIGRAVTERPDLLAGAVMWAPMSNATRFETTEGGPQNIAEFGSTSTPDGFRALQAMDAYAHVVNGTRYPAVLISVGLNDHRVPPWMGAELAARLQAAQHDRGRPVLLRVDDQAGHHVMGASKADIDAQITDMLAFVLWRSGAGGFD